MTPKEIIDTYFYRENPFAVKTSAGFYVPVYRNVAEKDIVKHLNGGHIIGCYQSRSDETCKWSCIDFDDMKYENVANKIVADIKAALPHEIVKDAMLERSNSKGFHVWLFFNKPIRTEDAHEMLTTILGFNFLEPGRSFKIDIFPRSPHLSGKRVGWLVRLPMNL